MGFAYTTQLIRSGLTYEGYRQLMHEILIAPAGDESSEKMRGHIRNNLEMMNRFDRSYVLSGEICSLMEAAKSMVWLVLTEPWCGDAAYHIPLMALLEKAYPEKLVLRMLSRDAHPDLMDTHLTNGGRSIPKLICLDPQLSELGSWGPRPTVLHQMVGDWKIAGMPMRELISRVHDWYVLDDTRSVQAELSGMIRSFVG